MHAHGRVLRLLASLAAALAPLPALACTLSITNNGALGMAVGNNTQLGSQLGTGSAATLTTILPLLSGVTIDIGAPTLVQQPAGYSFGTSTPEVAYTAGVLNLVPIKTQPYTASASSFPTGLLGIVTVTIVMQNRVTNTAGFPAGHYRTRTVVTCHP
ncbi:MULTISPECIES: hypothetical protein [unclassified Devosia]|uniref:hypothetical protein n=1 Tax=unclassified Devosia TaxID=196773 RepID=UPI0012E343DC|nr:MULTISPECIES: hypothetical protein [unclassified Devosia]